MHSRHVAHHEHVAVFIVHANPVHPQELGQQCVAMTLHNILEGGREGGSGRDEQLRDEINNSLFHREPENFT